MYRGLGYHLRMSRPTGAVGDPDQLYHLTGASLYVMFFCWCSLVWVRDGGRLSYAAQLSGSSTTVIYPRRRMITSASLLQGPASDQLHHLTSAGAPLILLPTVLSGLSSAGQSKSALSPDGCPLGVCGPKKDRLLLRDYARRLMSSRVEVPNFSQLPTLEVSCLLSTTNRASRGGDSSQQPTVQIEGVIPFNNQPCFTKTGLLPS